MGRKPIGKRAMTATERQRRRRAKLRDRNPEQDKQEMIFGWELAGLLKKSARRFPLLQAEDAAKRLRHWNTEALDHLFEQMRREQRSRARRKASR